MRVLGIDPGSRHTGYAVIEERESRLRLLAIGTVSPGDGRPLPERLAAIHESLADVLARTAPDAVSVEEVFHAKNARSALVLGQARGVALLAAALRGIEVHEYSASEIKRSVAGTGRGAKEQVARMVALLLGGAVPGDEHACDAAAAAICHLHRARLPVAVRAPVKGKSVHRPGRRPGRSTDTRFARKAAVLFGSVLRAPRLRDRPGDSWRISPPLSTLSKRTSGRRGGRR